MLRTAVVTIMLLVPFAAAAGAPVDLHINVFCTGHFIEPNTAFRLARATGQLTTDQVIFQIPPFGFLSGQVTGTRNGFLEFLVRETTIVAPGEGVGPTWGQVAAKGKGPLFIGFGMRGIEDETGFAMTCSTKSPKAGRPRRH